MESGSFVPPEQVQGEVAEQLPPSPWPDLSAEPEAFEPDPEPEEKPDPWEEFPPEARLDVEGLLRLGYLEDNFSFAGHHFTIKTLTGEEELAAALAIQEYRGTLKEPEAWIWAQVAVALKAVDGAQDFCPPLGPDVNDYARARLQYVKKWFYPVAEYIFVQHYMPLQQRQVDALEGMRGLSERNR